jgi:hypothetical protein
LDQRHHPDRGGGLHARSRRGPALREGRCSGPSWAGRVSASLASCIQSADGATVAVFRLCRLTNRAL